MLATSFSVAAVPTWNRMPGDSVDHLVTMARTARDLAAAGSAVLERWPAERPPLRLIAFPVLGLAGSGAGRRQLGLLPKLALDARVLAIDLTSPDTRLQPIIDMCAEYSVFACTSAIEVHPAMPNLLFHTGFVFGPGGLVLRTPKVWARSGPSITLVGAIRDRYTEVFGADAIVPVAQTEIGRIGCVVEAELEADGAIDLLTSRHADLIVHPALRTGEHPSEPEDARLAAVATRTGATVISCCALGEEVDDNNGGWARCDFVDGTSIWSSVGERVDEPDHEDSSARWAAIIR